MQCKYGTRISEDLRSDKVSPWLLVVLGALDAFYTHILKKKMVLTSVLRSPEEQIASCHKWHYRSAFQHCAGEAADIRSRNLDQGQKNRVVDFANGALGEFCHLALHTKGTGEHFHVNLIGDYTDQAKIWALVKNADGEDVFVGNKDA